MTSVKVGDVTLFYEEKGAGRPLLFCHGIPTDHRAWTQQLEEFSKTRRAISYSRRYAFPNERAGDLSDSTVSNNASDLKGLVEALGLAEVDLVGHSYGGFAAACFAAENPQMVSSLVLVEPAISTLLVEDADSPAQMLSLLFRSPSVALSARRFQSRYLKPSFAALASGRADRAVELNVDGVEDSQGAFAAMAPETKRMMLDNAKTVGELRTRFPPFKPQIGRIKARTLVVNGAESALWLRRIGQLTASGIAGSQLVAIPGSRHFPHMENAPEFNARLAAFLAA